MAFKNTVSDNLWESLEKLMQFEDLKDFRLVSGTSLILQFNFTKDCTNKSAVLNNKLNK